MKYRHSQNRRLSAIFICAGLFAGGINLTQAETFIPAITSSSGYSTELTAAAASEMHNPPV